MKRWIHIIFFMLLLLAACSGRFSRKAELNPGIHNTPPLSPPNRSKAEFVKNPEPDYLSLANALIERGFYRVALVQLDEARKKDHNNPQIYYLMGICHKALGEFKRAEALFRKSLEKDPRYAPAYSELGTLYDRKGDRKTAMTYYKKAIEIDPSKPEFFNNIGFSEIMSGDLKAAELHLLESLKLDPGSLRTLNNLAYCYLKMGREKKAVSILKTVLPQDQVYSNLGAMYELQHNSGKAAEMYRKALKVNPNLSKVRARLNHLTGRTNH